MPKYVAIINQPGFLPEDDPATFGTPTEAWQYLLDERIDHEKQAEVYDPDNESKPVTQLRACVEYGDDPENIGVIQGPTPGEDPDDPDLAIVYEVQVSEQG